jgi:hypothetical protein
MSYVTALYVCMYVCMYVKHVCMYCLRKCQRSGASSSIVCMIEVEPSLAARRATLLARMHDVCMYVCMHACSQM